MIAELLYFAMIAALFTHELDAVRRHEWRILPLFRVLEDKRGEQLFIWLHIPLFLMILWFSVDGYRSDFAIALSCFAIVHVGLHWLLRRHPSNDFNNWSSWSIIGLTGLLGAAHLLVLATH